MHHQPKQVLMCIAELLDFESAVAFWIYNSVHNNYNNGAYSWFSSIWNHTCYKVSIPETVTSSGPVWDLCWSFMARLPILSPNLNARSHCAAQDILKLTTLSFLLCGTRITPVCHCARITFHVGEGKVWTQDVEA